MADDSWGILQSRNEQLQRLLLREKSYAFGGSNEDACIDLSSMGSYISPLHFVISRSDSSQPVFIKNHSLLHGVYVNGELLGSGCQRILMKDDIIGVSKNRNGQIYKFIDYKYPPIDTVVNTFPPLVTLQYFVELKPLAEGAFGTVFIAHDVKTCEKVAIKKPKDPDIEINSNETVYLRQFHHPCIIKLIKIVYFEDSKYIITQLMAETLLQRIKRSNIIKGKDGKRFGRGLPEYQVKVLFYQLAKAVEYLHSLNIAHRNIKTTNIMLESKERYALLKLIDFGVY